VKALDKTEWRMGYLDRFRGMLEIPLLEFIPGGDVPWHRVYYFKKGREVMWDRNTRVDKIFGSGDAAEHDDGKGGAKGNNKKAAGKGKKGGQDKGASAAPSTAVPEKVRVRHGGDRSSRRAFHSLRTLCRLSSLSLLMTVCDTDCQQASGVDTSACLPLLYHHTELAGGLAIHRQQDRRSGTCTCCYDHQPLN
jgi:hypothetical protein